MGECGCGREPVKAKVSGTSDASCPHSRCECLDGLGPVYKTHDLQDAILDAIKKHPWALKEGNTNWVVDAHDILADPLFGGAGGCQIGEHSVRFDTSENIPFVVTGSGVIYVPMYVLATDREPWKPVHDVRPPEPAAGELGKVGGDWK